MNELLRHPFPASPLPATTQVADGFPRRAWTADEVRRMVEAGIIDDREPFELIGGELVAKMNKGIQHEALKQSLMLHWGKIIPDHIKFALESPLRLGLYECFTPTAIFISDQIGISKPNPKLYQRACDEGGVQPRETLYVGDHALQDIDPANALGMITVHIRRGRHAPEQGKTKASYELKNFKELLTVLRKDFNIRA